MLRAEDRLDLYELSMRFARGFDTPDPAGLAALFVEDGTFDLPDGTRLAGADLADYIAERAEASPRMRHLTTNVLVEEIDETTRGSAYFLAVRLSDERRLLIRNLGRYDDEYVRTEHGWRFRSRRVTPELSPDVMDQAFLFADVSGGL